MKDSAFAEKHPWTQSWYKAAGGNIWVLVFLVLIHTLSLVGLILYPLPGWENRLGRSWYPADRKGASQATEEQRVRALRARWCRR